MKKNRLIIIIVIVILIVFAFLLIIPMGSEVREVSPEMAEKYIPAKNYLEKGQDEKDGYGLYSYILFSYRPEKDDSIKYAELIKTYINKIPKLNELTIYLNDSSINVVYCPVVEDPELYFDTLSIEQSIGWLIDNYDYARASLYLNKIDVDLSEGPYIVSYNVPISKSGVIHDKYLLQDFSKVHYKVVSLWVDEFLKQSSQIEYWNEEKLNNFGNDLRNAIAYGAEGLIEVKKSLGWWEESLKGWIVFRN